MIKAQESNDRVVHEWWAIGNVVNPAHEVWRLLPNCGSFAPQLVNGCVGDAQTENAIAIFCGLETGQWVEMLGLESVMGMYSDPTPDFPRSEVKLWHEGPACSSCV
jgi:hypothetical protein